MKNYKNLVCKGGGILGIAYLGALKRLDELGIYSDIEKVAGASAGSISALLISMCDNANEIKFLADKLEFDKIPEKRTKKTFWDRFKPFHKIAEDKDCVKRLLDDYGWYSSDYFYQWLLQIIQGKFEESDVSQKYLDKNGKQTFQDFIDIGFKELHISVTNCTLQKNEMFSVFNKPDMAVADAVRMSMSIPFFFESIEYNGYNYVDGGVTNNYPIDTFDKEVDGDIIPNEETLGLHLYSPGETFVEPYTGKKVKELINHTEDVFQSILGVQNDYFNKIDSIRDRSININNLGYKVTGFDVVTDYGNPLLVPVEDRGEYDKLYVSGYNTVDEYFKN